MTDDILDLGILLIAVLSAEVIHPFQALEDVIDNGDENRDTDGISPDHDDGDDISPAVIRVAELVMGRGIHRPAASSGEPTKETEQSSEDVDSKNGADQLPRGPRLPAASHEDEPVLRQRDLQEQHLLDGPEVLYDAAVAQVQGAAHDPRTRRQEDAQYHADHPDLLQLPLHGSRLHVRVVVRHRYRCQIGKQRDEHDEVGPDRLVDDHHRGRKVDLQVQTQSDTVLHVGFHPLEDLAWKLASCLG